MDIPRPRQSLEIEWREIHDFPGYSVSSEGQVRNDFNGRVLALLKNNRGIVFVGMMRNREQHSRVVSVLVGREFLPSPPHPSFDTVINLDGDRSNNHVSNLVWRPRWFAYKYHRQFGLEIYKREKMPIEIAETGEYFSDIWDAVRTYGLLFIDVWLAAINYIYYSPYNQRVWPIDMTFRPVK